MCIHDYNFLKLYSISYVIKTNVTPTIKTQESTLLSIRSDLCIMLSLPGY